MSYPSYPPYDSYGGGDEYADPGSGLDDPDEAGGSGLDDLDEAGGGDGSGTGDGGYPDWPPNLKLKAVQEIKAKAEGVETDLTTEWRTSNQAIPPGGGSGDVNPTIVVGGETVESLKTALDDDVWDSPAAEGYRVWITGGIDAVATMLSCIVEDLTSAENVQLTYPGKRAEPGSPEATWRQAQ